MRWDYQIIYIASGLGHFHFDKPENETIVPAGNMVLFRPKELQKYEYYGEDKTEVYWIHFTGSDVKNILRSYGLQDNQRVFPVGSSLEYERLFKQIIQELQRCQEHYEEMLALLLRHLLIVFQRELTRVHILKNEYLDREMHSAVTYFNENYNQELQEIHRHDTDAVYRIAARQQCADSSGTDQLFDLRDCEDSRIR